jgi:hypothetical protein
VINGELGNEKVFGTTRDGRWIERPEINSVGHLSGNSEFVLHHRDDQMWRSGGHDLALEITGVRTDGTVAVNQTIEVDLQLANRQEVDFTTGLDSRVTLWALPSGVLNYQDRLRAGTVDISERTIVAGGSDSLTAEVRLPSDTPPGPYHIAARLETRSEDGDRDNLPGNDWAKAPEGFELAGRRLTLESNGEGQVARNNNSLIYANGALVSLSANSGKGAAFMGWSGDSLSGESQITLEMTADKELTAAFARLAALRVTTRGGGNVSGAGSAGGVPLGEIAALTADPLPGWRFAGWSGDASGTMNPLEVTMDAAKAIEARFELPLVGWREIHFSAGDLENESVTIDSADPDGDGLPNWHEYLHGSDPMNPASGEMLDAGKEGVWFRVLFTRNPSPEDGFSLECQGSRNLTLWESAEVEERVISEDAGIETVEARLPIENGRAGFLRFEYQNPME